MNIFKSILLFFTKIDKEGIFDNLKLFLKEKLLNFVISWFFISSCSFFLNSIKFSLNIFCSLFCLNDWKNKKIPKNSSTLISKFTNPNFKSKKLFLSLFISIAFSEFFSLKKLLLFLYPISFIINLKSLSLLI